jgi:ATP-dependent Lon protease
MFTREKQDLKRVPMMPVRDMVIFPQQMTPFIVGREASVRALEEALAGDKKIFLSTQHDASVDDPKPEEIYAVGTLANIVQSVKLPDGNIKVLVEGVERARALSIASEEGFFRATVRLLNARVEPSPAVDQTVQKITGLYEQFIKLSQSLNYDTMIAAARGDDPARLSDTIAANLQLPVDEKQDLLETVDPIERLNRIGDILEIELEKLNVDRNINTRVKRQMERAQKEYYLNEKLKAIQK